MTVDSCMVIRSNPLSMITSGLHYAGWQINLHKKRHKSVTKLVTLEKKPLKTVKFRLNNIFHIISSN